MPFELPSHDSWSICSVQSRVYVRTSYVKISFPSAFFFGSTLTHHHPGHTIIHCDWHLLVVVVIIVVSLLYVKGRELNPNDKNNNNSRKRNRVSWKSYPPVWQKQERVPTPINFLEKMTRKLLSLSSLHISSRLHGASTISSSSSSSSSKGSIMLSKFYHSHYSHHHHLHQLSRTCHRHRRHFVVVPASSTTLPANSSSAKKYQAFHSYSSSSSSSFASPTLPVSNISSMSNYLKDVLRTKSLQPPNPILQACQPRPADVSSSEKRQEQQQQIDFASMLPYHFEAAVPIILQQYQSDLQQLEQEVEGDNDITSSSVVQKLHLLIEDAHLC